MLPSNVSVFMVSYSFFYFESGSYCVAEAGLELVGSSDSPASPSLSN
jgi:hypothetical protein